MPEIVPVEVLDANSSAGALEHSLVVVIYPSTIAAVPGEHPATASALRGGHSKAAS